MRKLSLLLFTLILSSCGPMPVLSALGIAQGAKDWFRADEAPLPSRKFNQSNPLFGHYVDTYREDYRAEFGLPKESPVEFDIPINFGEVDGANVIGVCVEYPDGTKEVLIREDFWIKVNEDFREALIYHELGHCHLGRAHDNTEIEVDNQKFKRSVMHSILVNIFHYEIFRPHYKKELFTKDSRDLEDSIWEIFGN